MVNCRECVYRTRAGSYTVHSRCSHPTIDRIMSDHDVLVLLMDGLVNKHRVPQGLWDLNVEVEPGAIANGWGLWPFNFDPRWVESCTGFSKGE
jgi:hypothetical protein